MLETVIKLTLRAAVASRSASRAHIDAADVIALSEEMYKHIRHVEFISPAPTSEKCKQIHKHNITIHTQRPVFPSLCVGRTLSITDAVQQTSFSKSKALKTFPLIS